MVAKAAAPKVGASAAAAAPAPTTSAAKAKKAHKFVIDAGVTAKDEVVDPAALEKFLAEHIKINNKTGKLGDLVKLDREGHKVVVTSYLSGTSAMSKRYLKYLSKKYLRKNEIKEYVRVVAQGKDGYVFKYFKTGAAKEEDDE